MLGGRICLVTGASRGIGKGIALELAKSGATVYITGRTLKSAGKGSLEETCHEIEEFGGKCIPVVCDHKSDSETASVFERISNEQGGRLDVLVNNAYSAVSTLINSAGKPFWETGVELWDEVNIVGMRNYYVCSVHAAKLMVPAGSGLIVNISSVGGLMQLFNTAYGVGKCAVDRMAADMEFELSKHGVHALSLWPGAVMTEEIRNAVDEGKFGLRSSVFQGAESPCFVGKVVTAIVGDEQNRKYGGKIVMTADAARSYGLKDVGGRDIESFRSIKEICRLQRHELLSRWIPSFLRIPRWVVWLYANRFY